jgi:hypothetical protein
VKVVAFKLPKHDPATTSARTKEPTGPRTKRPNATATVLDELIVARGKTRK